MQNKKDIRFLPIFLGATIGVLLEIVATIVDEVVVGNLFTNEAFASVNLIEPYTFFEIFIAYLLTVSAAALIVRAHGAGDQKKMSEIFSQTIIACGIVEAVGPIFGIYVGEGNHEGLRSTYSLANKTAIVEGIAVTIVLVVIAPFVPNFLNVANAELASSVTACVRLTAIGSTFVSLLYLLTSYYLVIEQIINSCFCSFRIYGKAR